MVIEKQSDGSSKVIFDNGEYFFVEKGKDPVDRVIDISIEQKKTAAAIEKTRSDKEIIKPEVFFVLLFFEYNSKAWRNPQNKNWYRFAIEEYNKELKKQETARELQNDRSQSGNKAGPERKNEADCGKYQISTDNIIPRFVINIPQNMLMNIGAGVKGCDTVCPEELEEQIVAMILINLIYCLVDLRKIEARISEVKGLCRYLQILAPDAFNAYCALGDRIGFNADLDIDKYYRILNQLDEK